LNTCKKCTNEYSGNYCPNCGNPAAIPRIDKKYILKEIRSVLYFDKGLLFTIRELILRPGTNIKTFIEEDRNRLVKPIIFLIVCSLIYTLVNRIFHFEDAYLPVQDMDSTVLVLFEWMQNNYGYANIFMSIFIAFWIKVFFRKSGYNLFEILILIFFTMGIGMLGYAIFGLIEGIFGIKIFLIGALVFQAYVTWVIGAFFNKRKVFSYIKAFFAYLLGSISAIIFIIIVGVLIDMLIK
jgi:hypothetical protein